MKSITAMTAKSIVLLAYALALPATSQASAPTIPKLDLAKCEINKEEIKEFFDLYWAEAKTSFESVQNPMKITLQQVNLVGHPGLSDYFKISIRGFDSKGKSVKKVERTLEQLSVNYGEKAIAVGYAPYDTARTFTQPFSLLIEGKDGTGAAKGHLSFVALQSTVPSPMKTRTLNCEISKRPTEAVRISRFEVSQLASQAQFELIYNLHRLGLTGKTATRQLTRDTDSFDKIGLHNTLLEEVEKEVVAHLDARPVPTSPSTPTIKDIVPAQGRCGKIQFKSADPIYDSETAREVQRTGDAQMKSQAIGYVLKRGRCLDPARITEETLGNGQVDRSADHWSVDQVVITADGIIKDNSFRGSTYTLY